MSEGAPVPVEALLAQRDWVRALARTLVTDPARADDLEQDAWLDAVRRPPRHGGALKAWFGRVVRRRARDQWREDGRRSRREEAAARPEAGRSTAEVVAEADAHRRVVDAVMALEEPFRETVLLRFFEDLPPREVAARQGVPVETVRSRTRRALERLKEGLDARHGADRSAWVAVLVPLTGVRWEAGALGITGGAIVGTKAAVAMGLAGVAVGALGGVVASSGGPTRDELEEARTEVRTLTARVAEAEAVRAVPASVDPKVEATIAARDRRILELESTLADVRRASPPPVPVPAPATAGPRAAEVPKDDARRAFLDRTLSDEERATALEKIRSARGIDREIAVAVGEMFRTSKKAAIREWLLRDVHGTKDPELKAMFLEALKDPEEAVRERAARDIDDYLDDPAVVTALEALRDSDPSEAIRRRAIRTLSKKDARKDD